MSIRKFFIYATLALLGLVAHGLGNLSAETVLAAGTEELFRSGFEEDLGLPRFVGNGAAVQRVNLGADAYEGDYSLLVTSRGAHWNGARLVISNRVVPNGEYRFEARVKGIDPAEIQMSLQLRSTTGNMGWVTIDSHFSDGEWVELSGEWTAPSELGSVYLHFETTEEFGSGEEFYVDDVIITALNDTEIPALDLTYNPEAGLEASLALPSLHEAWAEHFILGNIFTPQTPFDGRHYLLTHHFGRQITAENLMKPESMQPRQGDFNFGPSWAMIDYAQDNDMLVVGHALIWHEQSFPWLTREMEDELTREEAIEIMQNHIRTVMEEFITRDEDGNVIDRQVYAWDVVNEAIMPNSSTLTNWRLHLRQTKWLRMIGEDYLEIAFRTAHEVDPGAILYYNDYNDDSITKMTIIHAMVNELREQGVPIHAIGMQGHYNQATGMHNIANTIDLLRTIVDLEDEHTGEMRPIQLSITELDITIAGAENEAVMPEANAMRQARLYAELFQVLRDNSDIIERVTFWGMDDPRSWRNTQHPNLFNGDLSPKPAFFAVLDPDGFLAALDAEGMDLEEVAEIDFGTPVIGEFDMEAWELATPYRISNNFQAWNFPGGTVRALWNRDGLALLIDVIDGELDASNALATEQSSVSIALNDLNFNINYQGNISGEMLDGLSNFEHAVEMTSEGYRIEVLIPLEDVEPGQEVGLGLQINYIREGEPRGITGWEGDLLLHVSEASQAAFDASQNALEGAGVAVVAIVVLAGVAVLVAKKRKK